ncbi:3-hydroxyacyl-CoA dehydrogenase [Azospirillum agricola]|uniref:3-hydroxyacyl-CoA dehydrogenase family protein n=1 Tax=Azospirillum agricola TaxID=1720247 RepID=UPI001AEAE312|nr:3-hydroxyacyl-CoA dehydrogenase NAD-binding domain-containing protein [Azospirillum agricola]MBP2229479.1 3-hydroxyacyl-CoA dehydrogenase [Azospirillum agricola]
MQRAFSREAASVGVVGAGTIGASWAALFLATGRRVTVVDPDPQAMARLRLSIEAVAGDLAALGAGDPRDHWDGLTAAGGDWGALAGVDLVQENGPESLAAKRGIYASIEAVVGPETLIASSTSGLMPSDLQEGARHPERILIGHPFNPPHLLPLVEIVPGRLTAPDAVAAAEAVYRAVGKVPVVLRREIAGHLATRLVAALWREAVYLVEQGVCDLDDIDRAIAAGPGPRWAVLGQGLSYHLGGGAGGLGRFLDVFDAPIRSWWDDLGTPVFDEASKRRLVAGAEALEESVGGREALLRMRNEALLAVLRAPGPLAPGPLAPGRGGEGGAG